MDGKVCSVNKWHVHDAIEKYTIQCERVLKLHVSVKKWMTGRIAQTDAAAKAVHEAYLAVEQDAEDFKMPLCYRLIRFLELAIVAETRVQKWAAAGEIISTKSIIRSGAFEESEIEDLQIYGLNKTLHALCTFYSHRTKDSDIADFMKDAVSFYVAAEVDGKPLLRTMIAHALLLHEPDRADAPLGEAVSSSTLGLICPAYARVGASKIIYTRAKDIVVKRDTANKNR